jgi:hypothetical protein
MASAGADRPQRHASADDQQDVREHIVRQIFADQGRNVGLRDDDDVGPPVGRRVVERKDMVRLGDFLDQPSGR